MEPKPAYPCIILAAGASTRMGRNKLLLPIGREPMLRKVARLLGSWCSPVVVVSGFCAEMTESALEGLPDLTIVHNPQWASGMLSSIQQGIRALPEDVSGSIIHHGDMPFIGSLAIETMIQAIRIEVEQAHSNLALPLASACSSVHGHPVYVPARFFPDILGLDVQNTLWDFLVHKGCKLVETGSSAVLEDIDTPDDYRSLVSKYIYKEEIVEDLF